MKKPGICLAVVQFDFLTIMGIRNLEKLQSVICYRWNELPVKSLF